MPTITPTVGLLLALAPSVAGVGLPDGFEQLEAVAGLRDPSTIAFAADGRLFIAERIEGRLRIAKRDAKTGVWTLNAEPFHVFDVPPERHRSSGLRDIAFDPGFAENGFVHCFFMKDEPRHNRLVRIRASDDDPDRADPGETVLLEMPFTTDGASSGSHNGGAVIFATDGTLLVTTGDGWNGGDDVQSLSTFTGKVLRINPDGSIPSDNPFVAETEGAYRAIYALGLRNPFSVSRHPFTGEVFVNDVNGADKGVVYRLEPGANYGHDGFGGIGSQRGPWANVSTGGGSGAVVSGGAWYGGCGPFPREYHGSYLAALWGRNWSSLGSISRLASRDDPTPVPFATDVGYADPGGDLKPIYTAIGPDGHLYYLASSYEAANARVFEIRPTGEADADADVDGDGVVDVADLLLVLGAWGECRRDRPCPADVTGDCVVGVGDILAVLAQWG